MESTPTPINTEGTGYTPTPLNTEGTGYTPVNSHLDPTSGALDPLCQPKLRNDTFYLVYMDDKAGGVYTMSQITFGPACCVLLLTSLLLIFLVVRHFQELMRLYVSLVFYGATQLCLCLLLAVSASVIHLESLALPSHCPLYNTLQLGLHALPGYGVLLIATARWICVSYPIHYKTGRYLRTGPQLVAMLGILLCVFLLASLPNVGVCGYIWVNNPAVMRGGYCHLDTRCVEGCGVFTGLFVSFGILLPILGVVILYCLIIKVLLRHRNKRGARRSPDQQLSGCWGNARRVLMCGYEPVARGSLDTITKDKHGTLKEMKEDRIPWSIIVILVLNTASNLPLLFSFFAVDMFFDTNRAKFVIVDIVISAQLICIAISPAAYFMTTPAMRSKVLEMFSFARNWSIPTPSFISRSSKCENTDTSKV